MRAAALVVVTVACANANPDEAALAIDPGNVQLFVGQTAMLQASSERDDVAGVTWESQDDGIATVDGNSGTATVTAVASGSTTILVRLGSFRRSVPVTIADAAVDRIDVTADHMMVPKGLHAQLTAMVHFTDGRSVDMTGMVAWLSADAGVASVAPDGQVTAVALGSTDLSATFMGATGKLSFAVTAAALESIAVGSPPPIAKGLHAQLAATGTFSDGTIADVTAMVAWTAVDTTVATVDAAGSVHAVAVGSTEIEASLDQVSGMATVEVGPAAAVSLALSTGDFTLAQSQRAHIRAAVTFTDGSISDVTATATWQSSAPPVVTANAGQIDSQLQASTAMVTATASGVSAHVTVTVSTATCHPVINEVQAAGASSNDEWVEIYNPCTVVIAVANWTLVYRSSGDVGATDTNLLATLAGTMSPGDLRLYAGVGYTGTNDGQWGGGSTGLLAATNGALGLRSGPKDTGPLVDSVGYGTLNAGHPFVEGTPAPALATRKSIARLPFDGNDTNDGGSNFVLVTTPTPRARNAP
jgi:uncharacterized protein YjdB